MDEVGTLQAEMDLSTILSSADIEGVSPFTLVSEIEAKYDRKIRVHGVCSAIELNEAAQMAPSSRRLLQLIERRMVWERLFLQTVMNE